MIRPLRGLCPISVYLLLIHYVYYAQIWFSKQARLQSILAVKYQLITVEISVRDKAIIVGFD